MYKRILVPKGYVKVMPEKVKKTVFIQTREGLMSGRRYATSKTTDGTRVIRLTKDYDVNKDGKIDRRDLMKGQIIGRTSSPTVGNKVEVRRHWRKNGSSVKGHYRSY